MTISENSLYVSTCPVVSLWSIAAFRLELGLELKHICSSNQSFVVDPFQLEELQASVSSFAHI